MTLIGLLAGPAQAQDLFTSNDYPALAQREGHQGTVTFRMLVDEQGKPAACDIVESSGWPELDARTCTIMMQRLRFKPATDKAGNPAKGSWTSKLRWVLPKETPEATAPAGTSP